MKKFLIGMTIGLFLLGLTGVTNAAVITFDDTTLSTGTSYTDSGFTLDVTAISGGVLSQITTGSYIGLHVGGVLSDTSLNSAFGTYNFSFSQAISSLSITFDALSSTGGTPVETIDNFSSTITYTNIFGTSFDGSAVTTSENDGQGIINYNGASISLFSFDHSQNPSNNGFVIDSITVDTVDTNPVPEPATMLLFGIGLLGLAGVNRRKK